MSRGTEVTYEMDIEESPEVENVLGDVFTPTRAVWRTYYYYEGDYEGDIYRHVTVYGADHTNRTYDRDRDEVPAWIPRPPSTFSLLENRIENDNEDRTYGHDVWVEDDTQDNEWVCRWACTCGDRGTWTTVRNRGQVQEDKLDHAGRAADQAAHDDGFPCANPDCEDCDHPLTEWDRAQSLIDDRLGK